MPKECSTALPPRAPFYEKGLRFECQAGCSGCCGGFPGYVWLDRESDVPRISRFLGLSEGDFLARYTRVVEGRISLKDLPDQKWNCVMLKEGRCSIYAVRPTQCRTYPFWASNLAARSQWDALADECPGIGKGRIYTQTEIETILDERGAADDSER